MKNAKGSWEPDTPILQQDLWGDELITGRPWTVVEDRTDCLVLYSHQWPMESEAGSWW